ncbi:MAG: glutathione S-transferase family protein, partial [Planctomycetota bacterium]
MPTSKAQFAQETGADGSFQRQESAFRRWVTDAGEGETFPAEAGRYQLYVSLACPWAHRTLIARALKGLEGAIGVSVVDPLRDARGWAFTARTGPDPCEGFEFLSEAYEKTDPSFSGRVTVPVLWDTQTKQIVNNESADLLRMLNRAFDAYATNPDLDLYPTHCEREIDALNARIYDTVNNGVYKAGFATTQTAYSQAYAQLFETLDALDARLATQRYLCGKRPTEADWRLFTTLVRFDPVYYVHFKCNAQRIADYPHLSGYLRDLYQTPGVAETVDFAQIKAHYYRTHEKLNPSGIVPEGPRQDLSAP